LEKFERLGDAFLRPPVETRYTPQGASSGIKNCVGFVLGPVYLEPLEPRYDRTHKLFSELVLGLLVGTASTFARAGFKEVARNAPACPIMRHDLRASRLAGTSERAEVLRRPPRCCVSVVHACGNGCSGASL
jgi:hypothetical protein